MTRMEAVLLALALTLAVGSLALASETESLEDERDAVLATLDSWNRGWAERNAELAVQNYAEDTDWTNAFGARFRGRDELRTGLEFIFGLDFVMAGGSGGNEFEEVTFLGPETALIRSKLVRIGQETREGQSMKDRHIHHLRVLQKHQGRWLIVSHLISQAKEKGSK